MKLSIPFLRSKKEASVYYLALLLTSEKTTAIILEEIQGKLKIINRKSEYFEGEIEDVSTEDLIEIVDRALSRAIEVIPGDAEIKKTVFGVKEKWVEKESKKIKQDYLHKLKKVCDALELTPIGFMVVSEAISNLIQKDEGAPLSAILIEHGRRNVVLTLIRGGRNIQTVEGLIRESEVKTVDALLKHFTIEVLPARIILYDDETGGALVQQFVGHAWSKSLPFLHIPQISMLPGGFDGQAVAFGAASQMGLEVFESVQVKLKTYKQGEEIGEEKEVSDQESKSEDKEELAKDENFGFVQGQDVSEVEKPNISKVSDAALGREQVEDDEVVVDEKLEDVVISEKSAEDSGNNERVLDKKKLPKMSMPDFPFKGLLIAILVFIILIGAAIGGAYYFYTAYVKASVIVSLTAKEVKQDKDVVFSSDSENDFSNNILAASEVKDSIDGDMTIGSTGKKDVGDKATGEVTIYNNNTDSDATLSSGTAIKSDNGLGFVLDKEVTVASAAGDIFSGTKPGTATAKVTASEIGTNYNLPSGTKFTVGGNSSLAGKNDSAFSGGSKKSVKVISSDDLAQLKTNLIKSLVDKALGQLAKKSESDSVVLPVVLSTSIEKSKYDNNAGVEAKTVKLSATVGYAGLSYKKADARDFAKTILGENFGHNMIFNEDSVDISVGDAKKKSDREIEATLTMKASLLPKIDTAALSNQLSGKSRKEAANILSHLPQAGDTQTKYSPNIYFLDKLIPNLPKNVTVTISSN